ncbi:IclR family transcriptional regulator [Mycolicibacterium sp. 018/SC-01/001]|uniref:IclR family transcriptional regulator n=1 Tax=Mycolicibacterium sp. 018/SC-01/001 TaxID=2592069 RepID=UPI00117F1E32|nr:IclR family transcriptional regulator [Mycolicibacterium sp. 018/SC-01/001]TRW88429.1 IclR family transcriptional regulator [Mycolicibacterium sp. 018/SC-01/001]
MSAPASNMRSLDRSFDVLDALQRAKHPIRLADVARASGLHIATAQRIVNVLVVRGYAARAGDGYTAGPASLAVAHAYLVSNPLSALAQPVLQQLAINTGYAASLYVRVEYSRVLIARVESANPLSYVLPVGERLPLHLGGAGKIFLAELDPAERERALEGVVEVRLAGGGSMSRSEFESSLERVREDGFAVSVGERLTGIASVTAPVRSADGTLCAVLGVTGSADVLDDAARAAVVAEVRRAAEAFGSRLPA